jgi:threonine dehydratase
MLSLDAIRRAGASIDPVFRDTPQWEATSLGGQLGVRLVLKDETRTPIRSFKGRGADFYVRELAVPPARLVCASAGNFGQGLAWAGRSRGIPCDVFAATTANPLKIERMRSFGATVQLAGADFDAAKDAAREHARTLGVPFIEDGREPAISEGAGTLGIELAAWPASFDAVIIPLGNGALLGGVATWLRHASPATRIIGVCATGAPSMERSWRARTVVTTPSADTIADGIAVRVPIPEAVRDLDGIVDDMWLVDDAAILDAMRLVHATEGIVLEPAGAVGVAALRAHGEALKGSLVATVLCGANVTDAQRELWFGR